MFVPWHHWLLRTASFQAKISRILNRQFHAGILIRALWYQHNVIKLLAGPTEGRIGFARSVACERNVSWQSRPVGCRQIHLVLHAVAARGDRVPNEGHLSFI